MVSRAKDIVGKREIELGKRRKGALSNGAVMSSEAFGGAISSFGFTASTRFGFSAGRIDMTSARPFMALASFTARSAFNFATSASASVMAHP
jgi:hypothetical protein